jgi:hypothetical protein
MISILLLASLAGAGPKDEGGWMETFSVEKDDWTSTAKNPWFILEPGYTLALEGGGERLVVTVLGETRIVDGVETRVVEERESEDGELIEVSRNFFAASKKTNDVFYFGEEVDIYEGGKIVSHHGAWIAGKDGARFGLMMPGKPVVGMKHYQEIAPGAAMDRAEVVSLNETVRTPIGTFSDCLKVAETTPLEPGNREFKLYAPGVGLLQDGGLKLVEFKNGETRVYNYGETGKLAK